MPSVCPSATSARTASTARATGIERYADFLRAAAMLRRKKLSTAVDNLSFCFISFRHTLLNKRVILHPKK